MHTTDLKLLFFTTVVSHSVNVTPCVDGTLNPIRRIGRGSTIRGAKLYVAVSPAQGTQFKSHPEKKPVTSLELVHSQHSRAVITPQLS